MAFDQTFIQTADLLAYYKFDEASGARVDEIHPGAFDLHEYNGGIAAVAGYSGNAAAIVSPDSPGELFAPSNSTNYALYDSLPHGFAVGFWLYLPASCPEDDYGWSSGIDLYSQQTGPPPASGWPAKVYVSDDEGVPSIIFEFVYNDHGSHSAGYCIKEVAYDGSWHYVLAIYDADTDVHSLYYDGTLAESQSLGPNLCEEMTLSPTSQLEVGEWGPSNSVIAKIDELKLARLVYPSVRGGGGDLMPVLGRMIARRRRLR